MAKTTKQERGQPDVCAVCGVDLAHAYRYRATREVHPATRTFAEAPASQPGVCGACTAAGAANGAERYARREQAQAVGLEAR